MGNIMSLNSTFALPIGLYILRNGFSYYKTLRTVYQGRKPEICAVPPSTSFVLNLLLVSAVITLLSTLPYFTPPNLFSVTGTRFQSSQAVIFKRLSDLRPIEGLDAALKPLFNTTEARLAYLAYGPYALAGCLYCSPAAVETYMYFSLPSIAAPHLLHLFVLGAVTSNLLGGSEASRWRTLACLSGCAIAAADIWLHVTHDVRGNISATKAAGTDPYFWRARFWRSIVISTTDGLLGFMMWLGATKRFFLRSEGYHEKAGAIATAVEAANRALWGTGNVRNVVIRDRELTGRARTYWDLERELYQEKPIIEAMNEATNHINNFDNLEQLAWQESTSICQGHTPAHL